MNESILSDEDLHAFVDQQLSPTDRARVLDALRHHPDLQRRVADIEQTRHLLRHAYERPPLVASSAPAAATPWAKQAIAAGLLLMMGMGAGWLLHSQWPSPPLASAKAQGVVIQVSEDDPAKWKMALVNARNVRKAYGDKPIDVEIVAYGPGLKMFRQDSAVASGLEEAKKSGIKLLACRNSMEMSKTEREDLKPEVDVVPSGIVEIMERQNSGYSYVRP